jgi:hypothetical protein
MKREKDHRDSVKRQWAVRNPSRPLLLGAESFGVNGWNRGPKLHRSRTRISLNRMRNWSPECSCSAK